MRSHLTLRLFLRESRGARGRLIYFVLCLALGVGAVTAVSALVEAVDRSLRAESRELIASDIKISSRAPLPDALDTAISLLGSEAQASTFELATMLAVPSAADGSAGSSRLVELKAASSGYPFFGELITDPPGLTPATLGPDGILLASDLLGSLGLTPGDRVNVGGQDFLLRGALLSEPDRIEFGLTLGPRALVSEMGLARTDLLSFGSRVQYARLLRLRPEMTPRELSRYERRLKAELEGTERIRVQTHREAQPNIRRSLDNVERYLGLVALLSLLLGGVGVAQVVRVWIEERTAAVAIQRSLGMRPREILQLYLSHVVGLATLASLVGCAAGLAAPPLVATFYPGPLELDSTYHISTGVVLRGLGLGLAVAAIFAIGPLSAIYKVSPARVLRSEAAPLAMPRWVRLTTLAVLLGGVFGCTFFQAEDAKVAGIFTAGLLVLAGILWLSARLAMWSATKIPRDSLSVYLRYGLSSLARPGAGTTATIVALGLGVHVISAMLLVETRLGRELRSGLPEDAPSVFLLDVQPTQWEAIDTLLANHQAESIDSTPVAMARLTHIDGRPVREIAAERERARGRARWVLTREQRLTWRDSLPESNVILDGSWFEVGGAPEISLEERYAEDLGASVGTRLGFDLQGMPMEFVVSSIREVDWASFSINFFLIVEPGVLEQAPHSRLASARLDVEGEQPLQDELVAAFPNVTLLRLRPMMEKIAELLERIAVGVRALGWVAVAAGLAILSGAVASSGLRRQREVALQKTLGMTRSGVMIFLVVEYGMIGLVAGACGAGASYLLAWGFLEYLMELKAELPWAWLPMFVLGSAALSAICGLGSSLRTLNTRPAASLRG